MQVRTVVDEKVFNISEHLIHHLYANISDDPWVLNDISETILHQLRVTHLTCMYTHKMLHFHTPVNQPLETPEFYFFYDFDLDFRFLNIAAIYWNTTFVTDFSREEKLRRVQSFGTQ